MTEVSYIDARPSWRNHRGGRRGISSYFTTRRSDDGRFLTYYLSQAAVDLMTQWALGVHATWMVHPETRKPIALQLTENTGFRGFIIRMGPSNPSARPHLVVPTATVGRIFLDGHVSVVELISDHAIVVHLPAAMEWHPIATEEVGESR
jgi:hypothetical protein